MLVCEQLQNVANTVVRRARRQGYVVPRDIRDELMQAGLPEAQWKEVVNLARESLNCRQGRYYHLSAFSPRLQQEQQQQQNIQRALRRLIRQYKATSLNQERRQQDRVDFIQPIKVQTEDGREFTLLSRDLSTSGIRLIGTRRLLGQKIRVLLPQEEGAAPCCLLVRILWTCALGDDMFENGGTFLEVISECVS
jgi:hypothetical protein